MFLMNIVTIVIALLSLLVAVIVLFINVMENRYHKKKTNILIKVKIKNNIKYVKSCYEKLKYASNQVSINGSHDYENVIPYYVVSIGNTPFLNVLRTLLKEVEEYYLNNSNYKLRSDSSLIQLIENLQFTIDSLDNFTNTMNYLMVEYDKAVQLDLQEEKSNLWNASHLKYDGSPGRVIVTPIQYYNKEFSDHVKKVGIEQFHQTPIAFLNNKYNPLDYATIGELMRYEEVMSSLQKIIKYVESL